jgi:ribosomal protein L11 methyltransferase
MPRTHPGPLPPGEGELFAAPLKIYTTGLAGRSFAKPKTIESYLLSWGRGQKVRAGVNTHSTENVEESKMKTTKALWCVSVVTTPEAEDAVAELLGAVFRQPVSIYFNLETGTSTVAVYLQQKPILPRKIRETILEGLKRINRCGLKTGIGKVTIAKMRREDWAESWKRHFQPIEIKFQSRRDELRESLTLHGKSGRRRTPPSEGRSLLIKPSWSKRRPRKNQAVVVLDPGLSFGTGQHPTTAFCLRELARCGKKEACWSFLDIGTGSGILAIAAAKLGYAPVHAFDFDPDAVRIARANARANGVHNQLRIVRRDVTKLPVQPVRQYDLICANLISTLLIAERRRIVAQLKRGGRLVLAGILKSEFLAVQKVFEKLGLKPAASKTEKEWRSGSFRFV